MDAAAPIGLEKAGQICRDKSLRARQLRKEGRKILGYMCAFPPLEFLTALDTVPHRIMGNVQEPITKADAYLEPIACPFVRSCLDEALNQRYDFLDGTLFPHSCDNVLLVSSIWNYYLKPEFYYFLDVPHMVQESSFEYFKDQLRLLIEHLEDFSGKKMTDSALRDAIRLHNRIRALFRELYHLRREPAPRVSGTEILQTAIAAQVLPAEEQTGLIGEVLSQVKARGKKAYEKKPRLMVCGCEMDSPEFIGLIEEAGADVVMDDLCTGAKLFWNDVEDTDDPLDGIARRYLGGLTCPRTYRARTGTHQEDLANRFGYLRDYAESFNLDGVVIYVIRYCDTYEFDLPDMRDYLRGLGLPVLPIENDYTLSGIDGLRTRIQAFVEMIA